MGGGGTTTTTNVNKTELPAWVNAAGKSNYDTAVDISKRPLQQFGGSTVADFTPVMRQAFDYLGGNVGAGSAATGQAGQIFSDMSDPTKVNSRIQSYMNPYVDAVEGNALRALDDSRVQGIMQNATAATKARAFGGTRSGIVDAVTNAQAAKDAGMLSAGIRKDAYDTANASQRTDAQTAAQGLLSTGDQQSSEFLKNFGALLQGGQAEQANAQAKLDDLVSKFDERRNYDKEGLNLRMSALGMAPYNTSTSGTSTVKQPSTFDPASLILGMLKVGMGAF